MAILHMQTAATQNTLAAGVSFIGGYYKMPAGYFTRPGVVLRIRASWIASGTLANTYRNLKLWTALDPIVGGFNAFENSTNSVGILRQRDFLDLTLANGLGGTSFRMTWNWFSRTSDGVGFVDTSTSEITSGTIGQELYIMAISRRFTTTVTDYLMYFEVEEPSGLGAGEKPPAGLIAIPGRLLYLSTTTSLNNENPPSLYAHFQWTFPYTYFYSDNASVRITAKFRQNAGTAKTVGFSMRWGQTVLTFDSDAHMLTVSLILTRTSSNDELDYVLVSEEYGMLTKRGSGRFYDFGTDLQVAVVSVNGTIADMISMVYVAIENIQTTSGIIQGDAPPRCAWGNQDTIPETPHWVDHMEPYAPPGTVLGNNDTNWDYADWIPYQPPLGNAPPDTALGNDTGIAQPGAWIPISTLKGDQGDPGAPGDSATITVGTTTTGAPGSSVSITNSGTAQDAVLDFSIPEGLKGDTGDPATVSVGSITKGPPGSMPEVTNSGTANDVVLDFVFPEETAMTREQGIYLGAADFLSTAQGSHNDEIWINRSINEAADLYDRVMVSGVSAENPLPVTADDIKKRKDAGVLRKDSDQS